MASTPSRASRSGAQGRARARKKTAPRARWSQHVTETSDALDLRKGVFSLDDPKAIARSLLRSARRSHRRKSDPYRSAMSMLTFYINRAGSNLSKKRRAVLEHAKDALRETRRRSSGSAKR